jgi:peptide/nickel transport system ATP-binding protein
MKIKIVFLAYLRRLHQTDQAYTRLLLDAIPDLEMSGRARTPVGGEVPNPLNPPSGCTFHPRCPHADERCRREAPVLKVYRHAGGESQAACHAVEEGRI